MRRLSNEQRKRQTGKRTASLDIDTLLVFQNVVYRCNQQPIDVMSRCAIEAEF